MVRPADVEESPQTGESPEEYVIRLAREKAEAVAASDEDIVLGADTVVVLGTEIFEKPTDAADAMRMLRALSGEEHSVLTGICLKSKREAIADVETTRVRFAPLSESEISGYVASGEPMDKAGAYAVQGLASKFIERIDGCYFNVVGLPIALVYRRLKTIKLLGISTSG